MYNGDVSKSLHERMLAAISTQQCIQRYALFPVLNRQNVAEHTGRATQIMTMVLSDIIPFIKNPQEARELACMCMFGIALHDLGESITGDIPYVVKREMPELGAYEDGKLAALLKGHCWDERLAHMFQGFEYQIPHMLVKLVDMAELVAYCTQEYQMGNRLIRPILEDGTKYLEQQYTSVINTMNVNRIQTILTIFTQATFALT